MISIPFTSEITRQVRKIQKSLMKTKDDRTRLTSEALSGIRAVKLYAWEEAKIKEINAVRNKELNLLWKSQLILLINRIQTFAVPVIVAVISFSVYTKALGHTMTPAITFTSLALFNMLRFPLIVLPNVIMSVAEALVTISRIQEFLLLPESQNRPIMARSPELPAICIENLTISYAAATPIISNLQLRVEQGDFVCVTGRTGCGKTTLLNALLCDVPTDSGKAEIRGRIAYCAQNAWIQSGSVRSNILFGSAFNKTQYEETLNACALLEDLAILPNGDDTEIGERGVNLSGGQKQR
ncbi:MAG: ABC transporter transmembrane domain-containing protein, partial [Alphaproteobacteria bacterium]|nr:ABC transporter transmembrane domain-containing protein [Alphaproteobacteria bacterium]